MFSAKKLISMILAVAGISAAIPALNVSATENNITADDLKVGDYIQMGQYGEPSETTKSPILWRVIADNEDDDGKGNTNGKLVVTDSVITKKVFDNAGTDTSGSHAYDSQNRTVSGSSYWADSNLRSWLMSDKPAGEIEWLCGNPPKREDDATYKNEPGFLTNFTDIEKSVMKTVTQYTNISKVDWDAKLKADERLGTGDVSGTVAQAKVSTLGSSAISSGPATDYFNVYGQNVTDKIFILDIRQYTIANIAYREGVLDKNYAVPTGKANYAFVRTPERYEELSYSTEVITNDGKGSAEAGTLNGKIGALSANAENASLIGVSPAFYIDENANVEYIGSGTAQDPYIPVEPGTKPPEIDYDNYELGIGDYISMGKYQDEPIVWRVVDIDARKGPLLLSDKILCMKEYDAAGSSETGSHSSDTSRIENGSNLWADSNLRTWLNSTENQISEWDCGNPPKYSNEKGFLNSDNFTPTEINLMKSTEQRTAAAGCDLSVEENKEKSYTKVTGMAPLAYYASIDRSDYNYYTTIFHHSTADKMFILDVKQNKKVYDNGNILGSDYWIGKLSNYAAQQSGKSEGSSAFSWLRTPFATAADKVCFVNSNKTIGTGSASESNIIGVRPAFYLNDDDVRFISGTGKSSSAALVVDSSCLIEDSANILENMDKDIPMGTSRLVIPELFYDDTAVIKSSSDKSVIAMDGKITAPEQDTDVTLTFEVTRGDETVITNPIVFTVHRIIPTDEVLGLINQDNVKAYTDYDKLRSPINTATFDSGDAGYEKADNVKDYGDVKLPDGFTGKIVSSSNTSVIDLNGNITPPDDDIKVSLTFEITRTFDNDIKQKQIEITVPKKTNPQDVEFFKDLKYGLFVHYVFSGNDRGLTTFSDGTRAANIAEFSENVNAVEFANDCESFGVQYVIFTAWHARSNPLYPSEVHKKYRNNDYDVPDKDILMPVVDELNKKGIKVIFYTHPIDVHDYDSTDREYFEYYEDNIATGSVKYVNHVLWNDYINELYAELCSRYKGKISGLWIDEGAVRSRNDVVVDYQRLRDTIKQIDPSLIMISNNQKGTNYTSDTVMQEDPFKVYSSDISTWRGCGSQSVASIIGDTHWYATNPETTDITLAKPEDLYRYMIYKSSFNEQGGGYSLAAGPYIGLDKWEKGVEELLKAVGDYVKPVKDTVFNTNASTSYPTTASSFGDLSWGIALKSKDDTKEYIHVLKPPTGKTLTLPVPADGKVFKSAKLVNVSGTVTVNQTSSGLELTLSDDADWDKNNTVIEMSVNDALIANVKLNSVSLVAGSELTAEISISNGASQTINAYMVLYNENGSINKMSFNQIVVDNTGKASIPLSLSLPSNVDGCKAKVFVWDDKMMPVTTSKMIGTNYALNASVKTSSAYESYPESSLTNGVTEDDIGWTSDPGYQDTPQHTEWVMIDLGVERNINSVDLNPRSTGYGFPEDFTVSISSDEEAYNDANSSKWVTVVEKTDYSVPVSGTQKITLNGQTGRYIMIKATKLNRENDIGGRYRFQLREIEVY